MTLALLPDLQQLPFAVGLVGALIGFWQGQQLQQQIPIQKLPVMTAMIAFVIFYWAATAIAVVAVAIAVGATLYFQRKLISQLFQGVMGGIRKGYSSLARRVDQRDLQQKLHQIELEAQNQAEQVLSLPVDPDTKAKLLSIINRQRIERLVAATDEHNQEQI